MADVLVPGSRDVRATLDEPASESDPGPIVVACPPHPQHGGHRGDRRLVAVGERLGAAGIACLRFDYGEWDEGHGEREDARNAIRWAADEGYDPVGVFGFSFGSGVALLAGASVDRDVAAVSALAPTPRLASDLDAVAALDSLRDAGVPVQVVYGERDATVDWEPVVERATARGCEVDALPADHFFVGQHGAVADRVGAFFESRWPR